MRSTRSRRPFQASCSQNATLIEIPPVCNIVLYNPVDCGIAIAGDRPVFIQRRLIGEIQPDQLRFQHADPHFPTGNEPRNLPCCCADQTNTATDNVHIGRRDTRIEPEIRHLRLLIGVAGSKRHFPSRQRFQRQHLVFRSHHHRIGATPIQRLRNRASRWPSAHPDFERISSRHNPRPLPISIPARGSAPARWQWRR